MASSEYAEWIEDDTRQIDLVASWETLLATYQQLGFTDSLTDAERIEEFKWIVHQMNVFLTRSRTALRKCKDARAMVEWIGKAMYPSGKMNLSDRKSLAYQKLRQVWMTRMLQKATQWSEEEDQDGSTE